MTDGDDVGSVLAVSLRGDLVRLEPVNQWGQETVRRTPDSVNQDLTTMPNVPCGMGRERTMSMCSGWKLNWDLKRTIEPSKYCQKGQENEAFEEKLKRLTSCGTSLSLAFADLRSKS